MHFIAFGCCNLQDNPVGEMWPLSSFDKGGNQSKESQSNLSQVKQPSIMEVDIQIRQVYRWICNSEHSSSLKMSNCKPSQFRWSGDFISLYKENLSRKKKSLSALVIWLNNVKKDRNKWISKSYFNGKFIFCTSETKWKMSEILWFSGL